MDLLEQLHGCRMARESARVNMQRHMTCEEEDGGALLKVIGICCRSLYCSLSRVSGEDSIDR